MVQTKRAQLLAGPVAAVLLSACQPVGPGASAATAGGPSSAAAVADLTPAAAGLCDTIAALPDAPAAERTFENAAHAALHALAAANGLDRSLSAAVLESMERVEADFSAHAVASSLTTDLGTLMARADEALRAIGQEPPPCD